MMVERLIYPVVSLGPGERLAIWTRGCDKACPGCANPELWAPDPDRELTPGQLLGAVKAALGDKKPDGITITGGEPLWDPDALLCMLEALRTLSADILVYSGYTLKEIQARLGPERMGRLKSLAGVLIDGRYIAAENTPDCVLRGSKNQRLHYFNPAFKARYEEYLVKGRTLQQVYSDDGFISVGIHNPES